MAWKERRGRPGEGAGDRPGGEPRPPGGLEGRILEAILQFPDRLDEMETRNEENCRLLASRIVRIVEDERGRGPR
jgi:hypothetical protein